MWNIRGKCFLFFMFMLLRPSYQILNVVALVKETSLFFPSANGREQFLSKNNTKIICLRVYKILEGFFFCIRLGYYFFPSFFHASQIRLDLFRLLFCLKGDWPCATIQALSLAQTRGRTPSTLLIRLPVLEQRRCSGAGIIEEIIRYLLFLLPGSFWVFAAARAN